MQCHAFRACLLQLQERELAGQMFFTLSTGTSLCKHSHLQIYGSLLSLGQAGKQATWQVQLQNQSCRIKRSKINKHNSLWLPAQSGIHQGCPDINAYIFFRCCKLEDRYFKGALCSPGINLSRKFSCDLHAHFSTQIGGV